jgi:hypothetical protein
VKEKQPSNPEEEADLRLYAQLNVRIPGKVALRLRRHCRESNRTVTKAVVEALESYLDQLDRKRK